MKKFFQSVFWQKYGGVIVLVLLACVILVVGLLLKSHWDENLREAAVQQDLVVIATQPATDATVDEAENEVRVSVTGCDMVRKNRDDKLMRDVLSYGVTWSSSAEYRSQRQKLIQRYSWLEEDSEYLTSFFPDADTFIIRDTSGADVYNPLDDGRNMKFAGLYTHVYAVKDGVYSYIANLRTWSSGTDGGGSATGKIIVTYDVNEAGEAANIHFYVVST